MTDNANASEFEAWNGESGLRWVARADERDRFLAPVADALFAAATPAVGTRVLDIGCGCGLTTLRAAATVGATGTATGLDISAPMLDVARQRARSAGAGNAGFVQADAQTHRFERSADLVISRFGTMFFADPDAAFANIATAVVPEGRLALATWQPLAANEWLAIPASVLSHHAGPDATVDGRGMFAQSDPAVVAATLSAAGFSKIRIDPADVTLTVGPTIDEAVAYLVDSGPARGILETIAQDRARDAALADLRGALDGHHGSDGVQLGGGIWLITATR